jgi:epoxyqueuosine reductase
VNATAPRITAAEVIAAAKALGFDDAAVVPADTALPDAEHVKDAVKEGRHGPLAWMAETLDQRVDLRVRLPWAKSVVVVVQSYYAGAHAEHVAELHGAAKVARYAWGHDYHNLLRRRLRKLRKTILDAAPPDAKCAPFLDVDAVLERAWAQAAGLGFIGKSAMFIHRELGTWTFLGGLATDVDLGPATRAPLAQQFTDLCGSCTACMDACPTHAITAPRTVDARRCLTTWNVEHADDARGDAPELVGHGWAVGCDVCQEACPWNRFAQHTTEPRLLPLAGHVAFAPDSAPTDVQGSPLARPGVDALPRLAARALTSPWLRPSKPQGETPP